MKQIMEFLSTPRASYIVHLCEVAAFECDNILEKIACHKRQKDFVKRAALEVEDIDSLEKIFLDFQEQIKSVTSVSEIRLIRNKIEGTIISHRHEFEQINLCSIMVERLMTS